MQLNPFILIFATVTVLLWVFKGEKAAFAISFTISLVVLIYILTTKLWDKPIRRDISSKDYEVLTSQIFLTSIISIKITFTDITFEGLGLYVVFFLLLAFCFLLIITYGMILYEKDYTENRDR